jgi:hypothetical protein
MPPTDAAVLQGQTITLFSLKAKSYQHVRKIMFQVLNMTNKANTAAEKGQKNMGAGMVL